MDRCRASQRLWEPGRITPESKAGLWRLRHPFVARLIAWDRHGLADLQPDPQWTGTQRGEGQSGMGPSSLAQGVSWGGQPSWTQAVQWDGVATYL